MEIPAELVEAKRLVELALLALPGVVAVGLGMREADGELFDELAVRITVENLGQVPDGLPEEIGGVPICLVQDTYDPCGFPELDRYGDLMGGVRISHPSHGNGTLGALVMDVSTGETYGLTCQHVVGDPGTTFPDTVWQPNEPPLVLGAAVPADDHLGAVVRSEFPRTPPLPFHPVRVGRTDAAVVRVDGAVAAGRTLSRAIAGLGVNQPPMVAAVTGTATPTVGQRVRKRGKETGPTDGIVLSRFETVWWKPGGPMTYLVDQVMIRSAQVFAATGDSGALVLDQDSDTAVGLLWGASPGGTTAIMSEIAHVETDLAISVVFA